ncbi:hypothetical protein BDR06DRAFT_961765 [Suillus hirtellus]|nr:hypothetical protein BDR06DRAFT_961765 [Suillus hirtellus]
MLKAGACCPRPPPIPTTPPDVTPSRYTSAPTKAALPDLARIHFYSVPTNDTPLNTLRCTVNDTLAAYSLTTDLDSS